MATVREENIARKIHPHIDVLYNKLCILESYLTDGDSFRRYTPESEDVVERAVLRLALCIDCIDRIEEIVRKIK